LHEAQGQEVLNRLLPHTGKAGAWALPVCPVSAKALLSRLSAAPGGPGTQTGGVTIDPTSARSGGSILGDKTRMERLCQLPNAFYSPNAGGDSLGGVARRTRERCCCVKRRL